MTTQEMISPAAVQEEVNASTREVLAFVDSNKVPVTDLVTLTRAGDVRRAIGERQKAIIAQLAKPKNWAHGLHQWFCSMERAALAPLQLLDNYEREQIRAFNEAETIRRQERERRIAAARQLADQARATSEAAALERAGEHQLAAAVVAEAIAAPAPVVVLQNDVKAVQSFRRRWTFEVTDEAAVPREFCAVDHVKLGRYATAMKTSAAVPGVRFFHVDDPIR
jgi:hypothetical protein